MHYSQQHDYSGNAGSGSPASVPPQGTMGAGGPYKKLLRNDHNALCLSCHDGQSFAPDVYGANTGTHVRQAGALPTGTAPYENWKGHTLEATGHPPGVPTTRCSNCHQVHGGSVTIPDPLGCVSCHEPHGNTGYRNLSPYRNALVTVTYAKGTNDTTKDVFLRGWTLGNVSTNYAESNVDFNEPNSQQSAIGQFCGWCHGTFHGKQGDSNMGGSGGSGWLRHPTADANIGALASDGEHSSLTTFQNRLYRVKVMSPSGNWGTQGTVWGDAPSNLTPTCITCHKAHGNQNPFGLIYMAGTGPITEEGDSEGNSGAGSGVRRLCKQCHVQGEP